jgi:hypothetical protein
MEKPKMYVEEQKQQEKYNQPINESEGEENYCADFFTNPLEHYLCRNFSELLQFCRE